MSDGTERGMGLQRPARELARMEARLQSGRRFGAPSTTDQPLGSTTICPTCGQERTLRATAPNAIGRSLRFWSDCACVLAARDRAIAVSKNATQAICGTRGDENADRAAAAYDVRALASAGAMTLAAFRPTDADAATYAAVTQWLRDIQIAQVVTSYRLGPPAALYLHGPRGRGKTHLAIALALDLYGRGRRVAILNERAYWHKLRGVAFGPEYEQLVAEPGERAWFTVFDDLGKVQPRAESDRRDLQNAWGAVLDRRYNCRRWCIFTSEHTLADLANRQVIDDSIYERVYEMTRGIHLELRGANRRIDLQE